MGNKEAKGGFTIRRAISTIDEASFREEATEELDKLQQELEHAKTEIDLVHDANLGFELKHQEMQKEINELKEVIKQQQLLETVKIDFGTGTLFCAHNKKSPLTIFELINALNEARTVPLPQIINAIKNISPRF